MKAGIRCPCCFLLLAFLHELIYYAWCLNNRVTASKTEVTFFEATSADIQCAKSEIVAAYTFNFKLTEGSKGYETLVRAADATFQSKSSRDRTWVATVNGDTAGIVTATCKRRFSLSSLIGRDRDQYSYLLVENLVVNPEFRRKVVATQLIWKCESWAFENGIPDVHIETYKELEGTAELYAACGYALRGDKTGIKGMYGKCLTEELWVKSLGGESYC